MEQKPEFDEALAKRLIGKYVLVGMTYESKSGEFIEQVQNHGIVKSADAYKGVCIELKGDSEGKADLWLPPDLRPYHQAEPGEYRLRSTGEVVVDPDYVCTWTITKKD